MQGKKLREVAEACQVDISSVKRWKKLLREEGWEGLAVQESPGRTPRLSQAQRTQLVKILEAGPLKAGYRNALWTCARVAEVIAERFDVHFHPAHVWKILRSLGFSPQKPEQRAREQDEEAVERWRHRRWPALKRGHATGS